MAYSGKYRPKNRKKYVGNPEEVTYRSLWERQAFRWCDSNPDVVAWSSEEVVVPYICETDSKPHRYFIDLYIKFKSGKELLVEIKPERETRPPRKRRKTKQYLNEVVTYVKNQSKWKHADVYAKKRGWEFQVWTEKTLAGLGIKIMRNK